MSITKEQAFAAMTRQHMSAANTFISEYVTRRLFYHAKNGVRRAPYSNAVYHNLDTLLIPVQNTAHGFLFNVRAATNVLTMTADGMNTTLNAAMIAGARSVADMDLMNGQDQPLYASLLEYEQHVEQAVASLAEAQEHMRLAVEKLASSTDEFLKRVNDRKQIIFKRAFSERIQGNKTFPGVLPPECSLCLGTLPANDACWIGNKKCQHEPVPCCSDCMMQSSFEGTRQGKQSFATCPFCRSEYVPEDVQTTGNA